MSDEQEPEDGTQSQDSEGNGNAAAAAASEAPDRRFSVQKVFLKDVSYEAPAVPELFAGDDQAEPRISMQLNTEARRLNETLHEVVLLVTVTATDPQQDRTTFLVEIKQAGLFEIAGFGNDQLSHLIGSYCPSILFPFAREVVAGLVQKGGMPQVLLQPINFDALYAQQAARLKEGRSAPESGE